MTDRAATIQSFLKPAGWDTAKRTAIAGDASTRRYERLTGADGTTAILMGTPPETSEEVDRFVAITEYLRRHGFSAPEILAAAPDRGVLLLEDLGEAQFAQTLHRTPGAEAELYTAAVDVLVDLQTVTAPANLPVYGPAQMAQMVGLGYDWYGAISPNPPTDEACAAAITQLTDLLDRIKDDFTAMILRDYHAENLIWLPTRLGTASVGLLDYQDAQICHPAYDLSSLLLDARRNVSPILADELIARFADKTGADPDRFAYAFALMTVQRNLRILGIFARLCLHHGRPHYVKFIPRTWDNMMRGLAHPDLAQLRHTITRDLPEPNPDILTFLREKCGTIQTL